jgi:hypothetical protein
MIDKVMCELWRRNPKHLTPAERALCEEASRAAHKEGMHRGKSIQGCPVCRIQRKCIKKYRGGKK